MAKSGLILALCVLLPALISASRPMSRPYVLQGRVYCDTCRAGFETSATTYIPGAKVRVECKDRTQKLLYTADGITDATGTYYINVNEDHGDETCDVALVSSPLGDCKTADPGRDRARVVLTSYNGIVSDSRFANAMGFMKDEVMSGCTMLLQSLMEEED
ncbi:putative allergen Ole e 1 [Helianthus annuus]|uniref:Allergen Ole e 1 n=1 Tax=Helianthus annuus TaxID=4232 RepID=A0A251VFG0_HELAN|nr:pollen-specific protein C13 [Helianthus annuus]KAF5818511.1 putative allergen Ole e 1 [Helianthus annuus]KAJ0604781.1 putative allergen Ole e 1 [Helianthus annuus]KAJ0615394.1 putative allergen Ole e 1 [Helianthus annuus]KAJ0618796.1 putative allergen Ole e 1 [Helianthus annuus]KAJ0777253.1 putative allergen Ole e 1 [Helianthus annuus]